MDGGKDNMKHASSFLFVQWPLEGLLKALLSTHLLFTMHIVIILQMLPMVASIPEFLHCAGSAFQNKVTLSALLFKCPSKFE